MRKILSLILFVVMLSSITVSASAAPLPEITHDPDFVITSNEIAEFGFQEADGYVFSKQIIIPGSDLGLELTVNTPNPKLRASTKNFSVDGRYYFHDTNETVSSFGLKGNVYYDGNTVWCYDGNDRALYSTFHNVKTNWAKKYRASKSAYDDGSSSASCTVGCGYGLEKIGGDPCEDASIEITFDEDGGYSVSGNYGNIIIN